MAPGSQSGQHRAGAGQLHTDTGQESGQESGQQPQAAGHCPGHSGNQSWGSCWAQQQSGRSVGQAAVIIYLVIVISATPPCLLLLLLLARKIKSGIRNYLFAMQYFTHRSNKIDKKDRAG